MEHPRPGWDVSDKYRRNEMRIILEQGRAKWEWALEDSEGEVIEFGSAADYFDAVKAAFDTFQRRLES